MKQTIKRFLTSQDGAVTVDMTILMALAIGLTLAATPVVINGVKDVTVRTNEMVETQNADARF